VILRNIVDEGARMKKQMVAAVVFLGVSICLTLGAQQAAAQGPAGAGASSAAQDSWHSAHSLNPINWIKKDKDNSPAVASRSDAEKKLTPSLQAQGLLAADANATDACAPFAALEGCLAALHASHNLGVDFNCLRADVTGVHTSADISGCKAGEKAQALSKAIHELKPDANAKQSAKEAEQQAKDDLKSIGA
jgi:hypothetical protein